MPNPAVPHFAGRVEYPQAVTEIAALVIGTGAALWRDGPSLTWADRAGATTVTLAPILAKFRVGR
jgi:hypothetical protein